MFGPLHKLNPLRLGLDRARRSAASPASASSTSAAAAASCPKRWPGAAPRVLGIDLGDKPLGVARLHKLESGRRGRLPAGRRRSARRRGARRASTSSPAWRCSSTCPIRRRRSRACATLVKPGGSVVFSTHQPQPEVVPLRDRRRRVRAAASCPRARTTTRSSSALRRCPAGRGARASSPSELDRHRLQPVHAHVPPRARHRGQLPRRPPPAGRGLTRCSARPLPVDAVLFDLDGTLADTAPDLAAALEPGARRSRPRPRCPTLCCARTPRTARAA